MSNISSEKPLTFTQTDKKAALSCFSKFDKEEAGRISRTHCIQALSQFIGREILPNEVNEIEVKTRSATIEKVQFLSLAKQVNHLKQERVCDTKLGEQFLIDNFTKREIKTFVNEWQKIDENLQGYLSMQLTRIAIENVLQHYQDSNANDSEIKQFFILKAQNQEIYFEEFMNFISSHLKEKKYKFTSKKGSNACACNIF